MNLIYLGTFAGAHTSDKFRFKGLQLEDCHVIPLDFRTFCKTKTLQDLLDWVTYYLVNIPTNYVLVNKGELITPDWLLAFHERHPQAKIILFNGDMRKPIESDFRNVLPYYDLILVNSNDEKYKKSLLQFGAKQVAFLHTATDPEVFYKYDTEKENYSVAFFGGNYNNLFPQSAARYDLVKTLRHKYHDKFLLHGNGWPVSFQARTNVYREQFARAASSAKIILGINAFNDVNLYTSNRLFNSMACGFYLTQHFLGLETMFTKEVHLDWFNTTQDAIALCNKYLTSSDLRRNIFQAGRDEIMARHTYKKRAQEFKQLLEIYL